MTTPFKKRPKLTPVFTLLETAGKNYWANLGRIIKMLLWSLVGFIPLLALAVLAFFFQDVLGFDGSGLQILVTVLITFSLLWLAYYWARVYASLFLMVKNGFKLKTRPQFQESLRIVWSYISLILLVIIFLSPLLLISLVLFVSLNLLPLAPLFLILILICALVLLALAFILAIFFGLASFSLFFENLSAPQALKRSLFLIEGYWWVVLGRILFFFLIFWIFSLIISLPLSGSPSGSAWYQAWSGFIRLAKIVVYPLYLLYMVGVYKDLKIIKGDQPKFKARTKAAKTKTLK